MKKKQDKKPNKKSNGAAWLRSRLRAAAERVAALAKRACASARALVRRIPWRYLLAPIAALLALAILLSAAVLLLSAAVVDVTEERILTPAELEATGERFDYILVLGCRVYPDGGLSHMLADRLSVAIELYRHGLSDRILMSGDGRSPYYNEVAAMERAAIEAGVPADAILTDPAGLSTYDSIARLLSAWQGRRVLIVTQEYHLYRALYLADKLGVEAFGVSADLRPYSAQWKRDLREILARCKDVYYGLTLPPVAQPGEE